MAIYYVATDGDDSDSGSVFDPWLTWQKAFNTANVNDVVYFREGTWYITTTVWHYPGAGKGHNGTDSENTVTFRNYPGETPILDGSGLTLSGTERTALIVYGSSYIHLEGLEIKNVIQTTWGEYAYGFYLYSAANITLTNCVSHDVMGKGFSIVNSDYIYLYNCDAYIIQDPYGVDGNTPPNHRPGNSGMGFDCASSNITRGPIYFYGCRAWACADQGFSGQHEGTIYYDSCWSWDNGYLEYGAGCGWKWGFIDTDPALARQMTNCIGAYNKMAGVNVNNASGSRINAFFYNNLMYKTGRGIEAYAYGFMDWIWITNPENQNVYRNNINYDSISGNYFGGAYIHSNNSWDIPLTLTDSDFVSLDWSQLYRDRKSDGSLPDITFGKLRTGSQCIGVGTDVGLTTDGDGEQWNDPPSLGPFEYNPPFKIKGASISHFSVA